jgi:hypothetical protein
MNNIQKVSKQILAFLALTTFQWRQARAGAAMQGKVVTGVGRRRIS